MRTSTQNTPVIFQSLVAWRHFEVHELTNRVKEFFDPIELFSLHGNQHTAAYSLAQSNLHSGHLALHVNVACSGSYLLRR